MALFFCHIKQWQQITQHAIHYGPGGPASILPHCSFTTGCQWQSLNNVNCGNQKVIQFKTCFTLLHSNEPAHSPPHTRSPALTKSTCTQIKCKHADGVSPSATGDRRRWQLCLQRLTFSHARNKWPGLSFPRPATTLSHLITCRRWTWQSFASSYGSWMMTHLEASEGS